MNSENMGTATIGQIIKHYREVFGFTQKQLAQKLGISPSAIANYELNYSYPRREILEKMAVVFNVSYNYLNTKYPIMVHLRQFRKSATDITKIQSISSRQKT